MLPYYKGHFLVKESLINIQAGIYRKINSQIAAFNNAGLDCDILVQKDKANSEPPRFFDRVERYTPWGNINPVWEDIEDIGDIQFLYFRHPKAIYGSMIDHISRYKSQNDRLKVFMEIPTYPYEFEYKSIKDRYLLLIDKYYRNRMKGIIDCIFVSDSMHLTGEEIFGIKCIPFINGYDVKNTAVPGHIKSGDNKIVLTCVAVFSFWHGYERLLFGLSNYIRRGNSKYEFEINFVGNGPELPYYKKIVSDHNLGKYVVFHNVKFGEELDEVYSRTDIGIACLGCYKKKIDIIGDLKTREYMAKGIPTVSGCRVDLFSEGIDTEYYREIPNDNTPVNMDYVVDFYEFIENKRKNEEIEKQIHIYSLNKFDFCRTIEPVVNMMKKIID